VALASAVFCVLLAIGGANNAQRAAGSDRPATCAEMGLPPGPACTRAEALQRSKIARGPTEEQSSAAHVAAQLGSTAAGAEAAGLMASLPGALMMALLAGGHIGGEWSGRTLKNLLTQHGRRRDVLAAKFLSLWIAGIGLIAVTWTALAIAGPIIANADGLPNPHESFADAAKWAGSQSARALLVLAAFAAIGLLAAVLTRNTIGTMATTAAAFVAMLVFTTVPHVGRWTPATWVQGWMGFPVGLRSITSLPNNFWSRFISSAGSPPSHLLGLTGLVSLLVVTAAAASRAFAGSDIAG
jgi:ABC-type transport system involved in multi-copper enzyme maturation permease subunit